MFFNTNNMQLKKFTSQPIGIGTGGGSPVPADALQFWAFDNSVTDRAIRERVLGQSLLISSRASNAKIIQSRDNSIITYTENEPAFNKGVGLRDEGEATNELIYSEDFTQWGLRGTATILSTTELAPDGTNTATRVTIGRQGVNDLFLSAGNVFTANAVITPSVFIKPVSSSGTIRIGNSVGAGANGRIDGDVSALPNDWARLTSNDEYLTNTVDWTASGGGVSGLQVSTANTDDDIEIIIWGAMLAEESSLSSYIKTTGMPATRAASNNQIPCLVGAGSWIATGVSLGDLTQVTDGWEVGVKGDAGAITFAGGVKGTFFGLVDTPFASAIITGGGVTVTVSSAPNTNQLLLDSHNYTQQELIDSIGYGNTFAIHFITSDYFTGNFAADTAVLDTLLDNAGYDVPSLGVAEQWPLTDFTFEIGFTLLVLEGGGVASRLFEWASGGSDRFVLLAYDDKFRLLNSGTGVAVGTDCTVLFTPIIGTKYTVRVTIDSAGNNNTLEVVGVGSDTDTSCTGSLSTTLPGTARLAESPYTTLPTNLDTATITLRLL